MSKPNPFANKIIGYGTKPADQFTGNPSNWRTHPQKQRDAVRASLSELGWIGVVVENAQSGFLIDGHERVWQALQNGNADVPYIQVDLDPASERLALAVFDPITYMAETDAAMLDSLLKEISTGEEALQALLAEMAEDAGLYQDKPIGDAPAQIDRADELRQKWQVEPGQMWTLAEHRLICGDCTDAAVVARLMGGERAQLMVTDPPYGVEYDPGWRDGVVGEFGSAARQRNAVANDDRADWADVWRLFDSDVAYIWHADRHAKDVQMSLESANYEIRNQIIWAKQHFAISRGAYHWQHEPCWYAVKKGRTSLWSGDRTQSTLWEIASLNPAGRQEERMPHGTQKPIECMERPIRNHENVIVCDPFLGSGTTIISCENLGRKCRAVEISPAYVAVALQRWADHTGKTPVLTD